MNAMSYRAAVVGSGPNGLAAAITLALAGWHVDVYEANATPGGAVRSAALTLPGYVHDLGSAIHPLAVASPFFKRLPLARYGLDFVESPSPVAHPLPGGTVLLHRSVEETAAELGEDGPAYIRLMRPLVDAAPDMLHDTLRPLLRVPAHPVTLARFGLRGLPSAALLAQTVFRGERARALFGGLSAHSAVPLTQPVTSAYGLMLAVTAHAVGWPFPRGGAQKITDALIQYLEHLGGRVHLNAPVNALRELDADLKLLDVSPREFLRLAPDLPDGYARTLRGFRYGPGTLKIDYALSEPIPWHDPRTALASTVHVGGTLPQLVASEAHTLQHMSERPYLLLAQHTPFDPSRAPAGRHTAWLYAHTPNGQEPRPGDVERIEAQIERLAPGFRDTVLMRTVTTAPQAEQQNRNLVGGDVGGGSNTLLGTLIRPVLSATPYRTPLRGVYLCSASTPPGGGVHGMAGHLAALAALKDLR
ncbi:phytoene desaturase family protein [Deinococcus ruber]|uniref:P49 secreted protein n=1 Tax=Deinococcus ruber TaxID=1848197 RepID=A0A918CNR2_9DEIO|nr:NAD(P)/FAD-dependent oxidoreductase [Deinococcus ruber]GGR33687.1 P49 secreted protein [Deinococcus ruber]